MKLKIIKISIKNCLIITSRYSSFYSEYKDIDISKFYPALKNLTEDVIQSVLRVPLVIFVNDENNFTSKASSQIKGLEDLLSIVALDITSILNPQLLILYKCFLQNTKQKNLLEEQISVIFIKDEIGGEVQKNKIQKVTLLMDLLSFTKPNSSSLDVDLLEKFYDENELDLFGSTSIKNLFPRKRKESIVKEKSKIRNPWLSLYLHPNKIYLSVQEAVKPKKEIGIIHCPICALEHKVAESPVYIEEDNLKFKCEHKSTQFEKYKSFEIKCTEFAGETFEKIDAKNLQRFFKNNIQPVNFDNVYMIKILKAPKQAIYFPIKKYMDIKSSGLIDFHKNEIQKKFNCPICGKKYFINFTDEAAKDFTDINGEQYTHYLRFFRDGESVEFMCDHARTAYSIYSWFSVKKTKDKSFKDQAILIAESFSGNYMDGKKIIVQVIHDKPFIIDMANYYEF